VPPGPYVMLAVSDTGAGMSQETLARLFRAVLYDEGKGQRHRPRAVHGLRDREAEPGPRDRLQ